jgi:PKHD-type hydroxylase
MKIKIIKEKMTIENNEKKEYYTLDQSRNMNGVYFEIFNFEEVKKINKALIKYRLSEKEQPEHGAPDTSKIGDFYHVSCMPLMELLHPWLYHCQTINREVFGYHINWNFHLDYFNYNVYGLNGEYDWHIDSNQENQPLDMKLTCLLNLSEEPYEGGEFCMINDVKKVEFTSGMGVVINSLIAHKVTPITKGERRSLTYWGTGPSWR